jgi:hypothetical protein
LKGLCGCFERPLPPRPFNQQSRLPTVLILRKIKEQCMRCPISRSDRKATKRDKAPRTSLFVQIKGERSNSIVTVSLTVVSSVAGHRESRVRRGRCETLHESFEPGWTGLPHGRSLKPACDNECCLLRNALSGSSPVPKFWFRPPFNGGFSHCIAAQTNSRLHASGVPGVLSILQRQRSGILVFHLCLVSNYLRVAMHVLPIYRKGLAGMLGLYVIKRCSSPLYLFRRSSV